jgi:hypothetical protein
VTFDWLLMTLSAVSGFWLVGSDLDFSSGCGLVSSGVDYTTWGNRPPFAT